VQGGKLFNLFKPSTHALLGSQGFRPPPPPISDAICLFAPMVIRKTISCTIDDLT